MWPFGKKKENTTKKESDILMMMERPKKCPESGCRVLFTNCNRESEFGDEKSYVCTGKLPIPMMHGHISNDYAICFYTKDKGHIKYTLNKLDATVIHTALDAIE